MKTLSAPTIILALLLAGCETTPAPEPMAPVDTFCLTAKKRTWDPDTDSVPTMREAVVWNRLVDLKCPVTRS